MIYPDSDDELDGVMRNSELFLSRKCKQAHLLYFNCMISASNTLFDTLFPIHSLVLVEIYVNLTNTVMGSPIRK